MAPSRRLYDYDVDVQLKALRTYPVQKPDRSIPHEAADRLLLAFLAYAS